MESVGKKYTFWQLLNEFEIEIPLIQRDYAQGRKNIKATQIREEFLEAILKALGTENTGPEKEALNLDFVYGSVLDNKFTPLDGQQRLTTLFLVHWYLAAKSGYINGAGTREKLLKFRYETRTSSKEFCHALVNSNFALTGDDLSEQIKDCPWFFLSWEKDPTIKAMLVMLDDIHKKYRSKVHAFHWQKLTEEASITFQFLNMKHERLGLTDELYVKMNARGKALTDFENFKSWFEQHVDEFKLNAEEQGLAIMVGDWKKKLDKDWTDLFWTFKDIGNYLIDEEYMRFFNGMALNQFAADFNGNIDKDEKARKTIQAFSAKRENDQEVFIPISWYKEIGSFSKDAVNYIFAILEALKEGRNSELTGSLSQVDFFINEASIFESFISGDITYPDRVRFFAMSRFLLKRGEGTELNHLAFQRWMRFIRNLVENTAINSPETFVRAISSVASLTKDGNIFKDIYGFLADTNNSISGFNEAQIMEERVKAALMMNSLEWEKQLAEAENHPMFKGSLGFLLRDGDATDLAHFIPRKAVAIQLFGKDGVSVGKDTNLLGRLLLALGLDLRNNELWLGGFEQQYWKEHLKSPHVAPFIGKAIDLLVNSRKDDFAAIMEAALQVDGLALWKKHLIENPRLFREYTRYGRIKNDWRGIHLYAQLKFNAHVNAIFIGNNRNEVVTEILKAGPFSLCYEGCRKAGDFYAGDNIELKSEDLKLVVDKEQVTVRAIQQDGVESIVIEEFSFTDPAVQILEKLKEFSPREVGTE